MIKKIISFAVRVFIFKIWKLKYSKKLVRFKDIHKGEDCFIIGNGPSLNKMDLTLLNDYYTFGLNKIYLIFDKMSLNLSYYVAVNPYVIKQSKKEISNLSCTRFLSYIPAKKNNIKSDNVYTLGDCMPKKLFYKDITQGIRQGTTVTFVAMQIAYYMGFKRVFLIGVDHNFTQIGRPHEAQVMEGNDPNHFDPNYFKGQKWQLADLEGAEISYLLAKYFFEKDDREIYDATLNGKLRIFKKINFQDALDMAKKSKRFN